ncbi:YtxH domain-containing protein [Aerococcus sp. UMB1112A]|uniref:YtxH domain-containing protein n=1 Tax=Aerococcus sp. UMB1112A TaxID=3050609 RepID=UPI0025519A6C|nr:YtxH domain-containing protein [Aerococcus sp. UMB1112A]MDK8503007.1 YtxH domain-containing protein [Aerococcus sp. UMB1112A]
MSFFKGLLTGALLGGVTALLKNPNTGEENRRKLRAYSQDITAASRKLEGSLAKTQIALSDLANQGLSTAKVARDDLSEAIRDFQTSTLPHRNAIQEKLAKINADLEQTQMSLEDLEERLQADKE